MHSHLMQYITPKGGPKSANHVEPNSRICLPKVHSETKRKTSLPVVISTALSLNNVNRTNINIILSDLIIGTALQTSYYAALRKNIIEEKKIYFRRETRFAHADAVVIIDE